MTTAIILFIPVVGDDPRSHPEPRLQDSGRETDRVQLRDEGHVSPVSPGNGTASAAACRVVTGGQSKGLLTCDEKHRHRYQTAFLGYMATNRRVNQFLTFKAYLHNSERRERVKATLLPLG